MKLWKMCIGVLVAAGLAGCLPKNGSQEVRVDSQDEAAAVLVSVASVAPWDQVASALQPNFALTGDQALAQVLPATQRIQEQVLRAFGASLGVGLPRSFGESAATQTASSSWTSKISPSGTSVDESTATGSTSSRTDTTKPGEAPAPPSGAPAGAQFLTPAQASGDIGMDPLLKYQAAKSLFESVQMMNREVQNAAKLRDHVPFLVRLRVAVAPYRPNLAYALHLRIGFFPNCNCEEDAGGDGSAPMRVSEEHARSQGSGTTSQAISQQPGSPSQDCGVLGRLPQIVPLLAADDIERALKSRASEAAYQIGIGLNAMIQGVGANLGVNNLKQSLEAISGQDFNSRLTVTRQADNTLYVRIGATNQASAGRALAAQNYDIALLLLAPRDYFGGLRGKPQCDRQVRIITHTQFRDIETGAVLDDRPIPTLVAQIDRTMRQILVGQARAGMRAQWEKLDAQAKETVARKLAGPIQALRYKAFTDLLDGDPFNGTQGFSLKALTADERKSLWVAASPILADTALKSAYFQLQWPEAIRIPDQTALVYDDTEENAVVQLQATSGTSTTGIAAKLGFKVNGQTKPDELRAQRISIDPSTHALTLTFPSPQHWFIEGKAQDKAQDKAQSKAKVDQVKAIASSMKVKLFKSHCPPEALCPDLSLPPDQVFATRSVQAAAPEPPVFALKQNVTKIVADQKTAKASLTVRVAAVKADSVTVSLSGADVVSAADAAGTALPLAGNGVVVTKSTTMTFQLVNVAAGGKVTVEGQAKKGKETSAKQTVQFDVVSGS